MTEPTGIPLLDRLDALQQDIDIDDWYCELDIAYPDLRALVLQYREERDRLQWWETVARSTFCEKHRPREGGINAVGCYECGWQECHEAVLDIAGQRNKALRRVDALVEALKGTLAILKASLVSSSITDILQARALAIETIEAALPEEGGHNDQTE